LSDEPSSLAYKTQFWCVCLSMESSCSLKYLSPLNVARKIAIDGSSVVEQLFRIKMRSLMGYFSDVLIAKNWYFKT